MLKGLSLSWFSLFGAPKFLISDQEGSLRSDEAAAFLAHWSCERILKAKYSHAPVVERHHEILRQQLHVLEEQATAEGLKFDAEAELHDRRFTLWQLIETGGPQWTSCGLHRGTQPQDPFIQKLTRVVVTRTLIW